MWQTGLSSAGSRYAALSSLFGNLAVGLLIIGAAACDPTTVPASVTVRDSAGVRVVENVAPAWSQPGTWRISDAPIVEIGELEGPEEYLFSSIVAAFRLSDGRIAIGDRESNTIRIYDAAGTFLFSFGGDGGGPGEFGGLSAVFRYRGDSIAAWDASAHRLSVFDGEGNFGRSATVMTNVGTPQGPGGGLSFGWPGRVAGAFLDGTLLIIPNGNLRGQPGTVVEWGAEPKRYTAEGAPLDDIGRFAGGASAMFDIQAMRQGRPPQLPIPYGRSFLSAIYENNLYIGVDDSCQIRILAPDGRLEGLIRIVGLDLTLGAAEQEAYRQEQRRRLREGEFGRAASITPAGLEDALREVSFPATVPPYSAMQVDSRGYLWLKDYAIPGTEGPQQWRVFDHEGKLLGQVGMPPGLGVSDIDDHSVIGVWVDELDVPEVRVYNLERG